MTMQRQNIDQDLRTPPHSVEAEQSVLGGLLLENRAWDQMADRLTSSDFYRHEHRLIYGFIEALVAQCKPADVITVFEHAQRHGQAEAVGGLVYLNALAQSVASASHIRRYAELVREHAILRKLLEAVDEIAVSAFAPQGRSVDELLSHAESKILSIGDEGSRTKQSIQTSNQVSIGMMDQVSRLLDHPGDVTGVASGFIDLDHKTSGWQAGDLILLAARPSMGKTALALNMVEHVSLVLGLPTLIFSMEMGAQQLGMRMAASMGRIDAQRLRSGRLSDDEVSRFSEAVDRFGRAPIGIDETSGLTHGELRARARRQARQSGQLGLIVVDYLQLMSGGTSDENRNTELSEISRALKGLAKELQCPVLALSQLNRKVEERGDKRPLMSDLRDSGALEQDADAILFIYRDEYYTKDACKEPGVAEIILAKQRNGPTGTVKLAYLSAMTKFENLARFES